MSDTVRYMLYLICLVVVRKEEKRGGQRKWLGRVLLRREIWGGSDGYSETEGERGWCLISGPGEEIWWKHILQQFQEINDMTHACDYAYVLGMAPVFQSLSSLFPLFLGSLHTCVSFQSVIYCLLGSPCPPCLLPWPVWVVLHLPYFRLKKYMLLLSCCLRLHLDKWIIWQVSLTNQVSKSVCNYVTCVKRCLKLQRD